MNASAILSVENDPDDLLLLKIAHRKAEARFALKTVADGNAAIQYLHGGGEYGDRTQHPFPQLVLLDLNMPCCNGFEVLDWVRQQPDLAKLFVVVFSCSDYWNDVQTAYEKGADCYLLKPPDPKALVEVMKTINAALLGAPSLVEPFTRLQCYRPRPCGREAGL